MAQVFHKPNYGVFVPSHAKPDIVTWHLRITESTRGYVGGGTGVVPRKLNLYGRTLLFHLMTWHL